MRRLLIVTALLVIAGWPAGGRAQTPPPASEAAYVKLLADPSAVVREQAANTIARRGWKSAEVIQALEAAQADADLDVRTAVAAALKAVRPVRGKAELTALARDTKAAATDRSAAIRDLVGRFQAELTPADFEDLLTDDSVKVAAAEALKALKAAGPKPAPAGPTAAATRAAVREAYNSLRASRLTMFKFVSAALAKAAGDLQNAGPAWAAAEQELTPAERKEVAAVLRQAVADPVKPMDLRYTAAQVWGLLGVDADGLAALTRSDDPNARLLAAVGLAAAGPAAAKHLPDLRDMRDAAGDQVRPEAVFAIRSVSRTAAADAAAWNKDVQTRVTFAVAIATPDEHARALRELVRMLKLKGAASAQEVTRALKAADAVEPDQVRAAGGLTEAEAREAATQLASVLSAKGDADHRLAAAAFLGKLGHTGVAELEGLLSGPKTAGVQPDEMTRLFAARGLAAAGVRAAKLLPRLDELARDENPALAKAGELAASEIRAAVKKAADRAKTDDALPAPKAVPADPKAPAPDATGLDDPDKQVRILALAELQKRGEPAKQLVPRVFTLFKDDKDTHVKMAAAQFLAKCGAVDELTTGLADASNLVRLYSAQGLGVIGKPARAAVETLNGMVKKDALPMARVYAARAVAEIDPDHPTAVLNLVLLMKDAAVPLEGKKLSVHRLGTMGKSAKAAVPVLTAALEAAEALPPLSAPTVGGENDPKRKAYYEAKALVPQVIVALGDLGGEAKEAIPTLVKLLNPKNPDYAADPFQLQMAREPRIVTLARSLTQINDPSGLAAVYELTQTVNARRKERIMPGGRPILDPKQIELDRCEEAYINFYVAEVEGKSAKRPYRNVRREERGKVNGAVPNLTPEERRRALEEERDALQGEIDFCQEQGEKLAKEADDLRAQAAAAARPQSSVDPQFRAPGMLTTVQEYTALARQAQELRGDFIKQAGEARARLAEVEAELKK